MSGKEITSIIPKHFEMLSSRVLEFGILEIDIVAHLTDQPAIRLAVVRAASKMIKM